jgi:tripartite-type tricarboxylate transporter receptor subunit TctC
MTAVAVCSCAHAHGLVDRPIRIIVPVSAGGTTDVAARLIADHIGKSLGRPVIVENRVGATGRIAAMALKSAAPDGNTLLLTPIAVTVIAPLVFKRLDYDPVKDFAPVSQVATYGFALAVTPKLPVQNVPEFIAWANAHSDEANFGTVAIGSVPHFFGVMIREATGIEMVHVPYGTLSQLETDLMSGTISSGISALPDLIGAHRAGRFRIIATSGAERSPLLPEVPTFVQQGFPAVDGSGWTAIFAPAGTPKAVIDQLSEAVIAAARAPEVRERFVRLGIEPTGTTPQELALILAADTKRWRKVIKASGFHAE